MNILYFEMWEIVKKFYKVDVEKERAVQKACLETQEKWNEHNGTKIKVQK